MRLFGARDQLAIAAVLFVAINDERGGSYASGKNFAKAAGLSDRYLEPILQDLAHAGIILGKKGNHGGYTLARPTRKITLFQIVEISQAHDGMVRNMAVRSDLVRNVVTPYIDASMRNLTEALNLITIADLMLFAKVKQ